MYFGRSEIRLKLKKPIFYLKNVLNTPSPVIGTRLGARAGRNLKIKSEMRNFLKKNKKRNAKHFAPKNARMRNARMRNAKRNVFSLSFAYESGLRP